MPINVSRRRFVAGLPAAGVGGWLVACADPGAAAQNLFDERIQDPSAGAEISLPSGTRVLNSPFRFAGQRLNLRGAGPNVSVIGFDPAAPAAAIELRTPGAAGQYQSSVMGLGFISANAVDKTAISLVNVANVNVERIGIAGGNWRGDGSIGIRTFGRQLVRIRDCDLACARPIVISPNPEHPTLAADFFTITSCELVCMLPGGTCIEIEDGAMFSNMAIRDTAMAGGTNGFRFADRSTPGASFNLEFQNCRTEQGTDPNGWSFDIRSAHQSIQSILLQNVRCDNRRHGIRIRNGQRITLINVDIDQVGGRTALDIEFNPATVLTILGGFGQVGGNVRLTNARKVFGIESQIGGALGPAEFWVYDPQGSG
jgi:hypothetical protein